MKKTITLTLTLTLALTLTRIGRADEDDPKASTGMEQTVARPTAAPALPDAAWRAVKDRRVTVETARGSLTGKVLAFEPDNVTLVLSDGSVVTVARAQVTGLRMAELAEPGERVAIQEAPASAPEPPEKERHLGVQLMLSPGIAVDLEYGLFYGFVSASPLYGLASAGQLFGFAVGGGVSPKISRHWHFDLFATVAPIWWTGVAGSGQTVAIGLGIGAGVHYTSPKGWTVGIKIPLLGAAPQLAYNPPYYPYYSGSYNVGTATGVFYMANLISLPIFSFGYRF